MSKVTQGGHCDFKLFLENNGICISKTCSVEIWNKQVFGLVGAQTQTEMIPKALWWLVE